MTRDGWLLFATRCARLFAYGLLSVVLFLYLTSKGLSDAEIGLLLTLTLLGDTAISLLLTTRADRISSVWTGGIPGHPITLPTSALTAALIGPGNVGHAATIAANSGSVADDRTTSDGPDDTFGKFSAVGSISRTAPDFASLENVEFPNSLSDMAVASDVSNPRRVISTF